MNFSVVILAGGRSRRMGKDKAFLDWQGRSLLGHQIETVRHLKPDAILISGRAGTDYGAFGCPIIYDSFTNRGPLAGIEQALCLMISSHLLVLAVDMPLMSWTFLSKLARNCTERLGTVPRLDGRIQPLAAFYPKDAHRVALTMLGEGFSPVTQFAELCLEAGLVHLHGVSAPEAACFSNWNCPADLGIQ